MGKFKAVIFDMDGVLIDSEIYWPDVEKEFFGFYGLEFNAEIQSYMQGRSEEEAVKWLKEKFKLTDTEEQIAKKRNNLSEKIYTERCHPLPGVNDILKDIKNAKFKTAIVSSTSLRRIKIIMDRFNWVSYFDEIISADGMDFNGKPAPDIYLYSAQVLQSEPKDCLVFEDSLNGVKAAKSAGMFCVGITDPRWSKLKLNEADLQVDTFQDQKIKNILQI